MTVQWALAGMFTLATALMSLRFVLQRASAAWRHLLLATAFGVVLLAPFTGFLLPRLEPVRRIHSTIIMVVGPDDKAPSRSQQEHGSDWSGALLWIWGAGALVLLARMAFALHSARHTSQAAPTELRTAGEEIATKLGIRRTVRFEESSAAIVAETRGLIRPVVTLPVSADQWPEQRKQIVLAHELLHIARHDWIATVLAEVATCLHWFNPLAWVALRELRREREVACDDAVLSLGVDGCDYAGHLIAIVSGLRCAPQPAAVAMAQASHLEKRIESILKPDTPRGGVTMKAHFGAAAFAACLLVAVSAMQSPAQSGTAALSGAVVDASSGRIPNASVIVRNADSNKVEILRTNDAGEFVFSSLPAGTYNLEVAKAGFQLFKQEKLILAPGSAQSVSVMLNLGRLNETINVTGQRTSAEPVNTSGPPKRIRVGGNVQAAKVVRQVKPEYPAHLKAAGVQGTVMLEAVIGIDGKLQNLQVLNSLVHPDLIQVATEAVRQWQWEPTYLNGVPVEIVTAVNVNFTLSQ